MLLRRLFRGFFSSYHLIAEQVAPVRGVDPDPARSDGGVPLDGLVVAVEHGAPLLVGVVGELEV